MTLLQMSFSGAVFILAVALIRTLLVQRLPKRTFLILWGMVLLRLLVPFSVPASFSFYSLAGRSLAQETLRETPAVYLIPEETHTEVWETKPESFDVPDKVVERGVQPWTIIWGFGVLCGAVFFWIIWLRCRWDIRTSLPVENPFIRDWVREHPLRRPVSVRQSDRIASPLTCGIFRPVILLPRDTGWEQEEQLHYVLLHEYIHIRHFDMVWKWCLAAALCIHWFNPAVWLFYFLCNRDIELVCDEGVIRQSGEQFRSAYALTLIHMEEQKPDVLSLYSHFSKNAVEERIRAVMKAKKKTLPVILLAVFLVVGTAAVFATSADFERGTKGADKLLSGEPQKSEPDKLPEEEFQKADLKKFPAGDFTDEESKWLLSLWIDGYEDMTVADYQQKMWALRDTPEKIRLVERFSQEEWTYEMENIEEARAFRGFMDYFYHVYEPLTAERWSGREFSVWALAGFGESSDKAEFESQFLMMILDEEALTVGEYYRAYTGMDKGMCGILEGKTPEELMNEAQMQDYLREEIQRLCRQWSSGSLQIQVSDWVYRPLVNASIEEQAEVRDYPPGTEMDYASLLKLRTLDYQNMSLKDFNMGLLDWANKDYERGERIMTDTAWNDREVPLTEEERDFVEITVRLSNIENGKMVQSDYSGRPEEDPVLGEDLPDRFTEESGQSAWCSLYYQFSYHIKDKAMVTVGERDYCVSGMIHAVSRFWKETDIEELLLLTEEDILGQLETLAKEYSSENVALLIKEEGVGFETMDERSLILR